MIYSRSVTINSLVPRLVLLIAYSPIPRPMIILLLLPWWTGVCMGMAEGVVGVVNVDPVGVANEWVGFEEDDDVIL